LAEHDRDLAIQLTDLLFMDDVEALDLDYDDIGSDMLSGPINKKNVYHYILCRIKHTLITGYKIEFIDALHQG
jgi:hypothetical protein